MANLVQSVGVQLNRALEELGARPLKAVKPDARSSKGAGKQETEGLSDASRVHVEEMLKAGMSAVASVVESRISTVETSVTDLAGKTSELEDEVRKVKDSMAKQSAEIAALRESLGKHEASCNDRFAHLEKRQAEQASILDKIVTPDSAASTSGSSQRPPAANANADVPYEQRVVAKIGGFTYDSLASDMTSFAIEKLTEIGVAPDSYNHLHCPFAKGSWLLVTFEKPQILQRARMAFQSHQFTLHGRRIWLDAAKTKAELKPARLIHRAMTALTEQEKDRQDRQDLEKVMKGKQVKMGRTVLAFTLNSELKWTTAAKERYGEDQCDLMRGWCESE